MSIGITAGVAAAAIGAGGAIGSSLINSHSAGSAADKQTQAAQDAQKLLLGTGQEWSGTQTRQGQIGATNIFQSGTQANQMLSDLGQSNQPGFVPTGNNGAAQGSLSQLAAGTSPMLQLQNVGVSNVGQFQAPKASDIESDPNYQWILQQGMDAVQSSAAAKGLLSSGGTLKGLTQFAQGNATNFEQTAYNQALQSYQTNANTQFQNWQNNLGLSNAGFNQNQSLFNDQLALGNQQFGQGLAAWQANSQNQQQNWQNNFNSANQRGANLINTNTTGSNLLQNATNAAAGTALTGAGGSANYGTQAGSAQAAGILGQGSAWSNALAGLTNAGVAATKYYNPSGQGISTNAPGSPGYVNPYTSYGLQDPNAGGGGFVSFDSPPDPSVGPYGQFQNWTIPAGTGSTYGENGINL